MMRLKKKPVVQAAPKLAVNKAAERDADHLVAIRLAALEREVEELRSAPERASAAAARLAKVLEAVEARRSWLTNLFG